MQEELEKFFASYGEALSTADANAIAAFYAAPGIVVADQATIPLGKLEDVQQAFAGAKERYESQGVAATKPEVTFVAPLSARLSLVHVRWSYLNAEDEVIYQEHEAYLVRQLQDGRILIVVVIVLPSGGQA